MATYDYLNQEVKDVTTFIKQNYRRIVKLSATIF